MPGVPGLAPGAGIIPGVPVPVPGLGVPLLGPTYISHSNVQLLVIKFFEEILSSFLNIRIRVSNSFIRKTER